MSAVPPSASYPPPSGFGPAPGLPGMPPQRKTSAAAVTSLVLGILGCIPLVTGLLAIILGIIGIKKTASPNVSGRGMAIAGLILGLVSVVLWGIFGGIYGVVYTQSRPMAAICDAFTRDMAQQNIDAALARCDPAMARQDLVTEAGKMQPWGQVQKVMLPGGAYEYRNGVKTWKLGGGAQFSGGMKKAEFTLKAQPDGSYKITEFRFYD